MTEILKFIKSYYPFIFFIVIIVLSTVLFQTCSTLRKERVDRKYQEELNTQNINALGDTIKGVFNRKLNSWEYSKDNYVLQKLDDLEQYNKSFFKELEKVKGDIVAAVKTEVQGDLGGITVANNLSILDDGANHYGLSFRSDYQDPGFEQKITGMSKFFVTPNEQTKKWNIAPDVTVLDTNFTAIKVTYGFKELKDKYQVFAISSSPKIQVTDLTGGYFINKQPPASPIMPKKWGIGPYIGYGLNTGSNMSDPRFGWSMGFSIHYDLLQWRFGKK